MRVGVLMLLSSGGQLVVPSGGAIDMSTMPLQCLESVDVVRGALASVYGSGAQGGVIRLNPSLSATSPGSASLRMGSYGYGGLNLCARGGPEDARTF